MAVYNKLIRDKIPTIIQQTGCKANTRILSDEEYRVWLERKLDEEVVEFHRDHTVEELADILEVVYALAATCGCSREQLEVTCQTKRKSKGGFERKLFLISTE